MFWPFKPAPGKSPFDRGDLIQAVVASPGVVFDAGFGHAAVRQDASGAQGLLAILWG